MKKYKEFINENVDKDEYYDILEMIEEYLEKNKIGGSFNDGYFKHDGDKDLNGLKKYLDENSSINNILDYFFNKYRDTIYNDHNLIENNGFYDYMLYTYDNTFTLNGYGAPEPTDKLLKYYYGFQNTKLGKLFIKQNFKTESNFYKVCAENYLDYHCESNAIEELEYDVNDSLVISNKKYSMIILNIKNIWLKNKDEYEKIGNLLNIMEDDENTSIYDDELFGTMFSKDKIKIDSKIEEHRKEIEKWLGHTQPLIRSSEIRKYNI